MTPEALRKIDILESLDDDAVARVAGLGVERRLDSGEILFREGDRATHFHIVLDGQLETTREVAGEQVLMISHGAGGYLGAMALLTGTRYRGTTVAVEPTELFELAGEELRRLAFEHPPLLRAFLPAIEQVSGAIKGIERDREKLLAVGKLAAGLAHELNNPAAAATRGVTTLREYEAHRQAAFAAISASGAPASELGALAGLGVRAAEGALAGERLDPLAASDREQELMDALEERGLPDPFELSSILTEARLGAEWVDNVAAVVGEGRLADGLRFVGACAGARVVLAELQEATTRIAGLVDAVRSYSFVDQAPRQTVDIPTGLESTLALLAHKLRTKEVNIVRDFDPELPGVEASGSELNQVWTNLIDNAVDAVDPGGTITLSTRLLGERACVAIADDGPGIPEDLQKKVFDAFVTTKPVGQGTGLGLDIAQRIVVRHHGELRLQSRPGDTRFQVILPLR